MTASSTYERLRDASLAIRRGARFIATNTDRTLPTEIGLIPGAGSVVAAIATATDVTPEVVGKPQPAAFLQALRRIGTPANLTACIGDRPETDILAGQRAGLRTLGVLTGVGTPTQFAALNPPADWIFEDLYTVAREYFGT